jgi:hypothetical protein
METPTTESKELLDKLLSDKYHSIDPDKDVANQEVLELLKMIKEYGRVDLAKEIEDNLKTERYYVRNR